MVQTNENSFERKRFHFDNLYMDIPSEYGGIKLFQIGDLSCRANYVVDYHKQICYEISYIYQGDGYFYTNDEKHHVQKGDIYLNVPNELHKIESGDCQNFRYLYLGFMIDTNTDCGISFVDIKDKFDSNQNPVCRDKLNISVPFLCALKELRNQNDYSSVMINSYINQILILVFRNFFNEYKNDYDYKDYRKSRKEITYNLINYFDSNVLNISALSDIAEIFGYSYSYLSHIFSEEVGIPLKDYYANKILAKAKQLLEEGELSITEISEALHYESIHSFSKSFKKHTGISPSQYKSGK